MKKTVITVLLLLLILLSAVYIFIPAQLSVSSARSIVTNREAVHRYLSQDSNWRAWWPGSVSNNDSGRSRFTLEEYEFRINEILYNALRISLAGKDIAAGCLLKIVPHTVDSTGMELGTVIPGGSDPFTRLQRYNRAREIKTLFEKILDALEKEVTVVKNIYGIDIQKEKVQFQYLVSSKKTFGHYPGNEEIYAVIEQLRDYAAKNGAKELYHPMLNLRQTGSDSWVAQLGLPVDKQLEASENITTKWMMKDGNILGADVTGGRRAIEEGMKKCELYISDYQRTIIAIPFQSLVTDRLKEPDSSRWVTRLYYPVI